MDGKGRAAAHIFTERLWRTVKYEDVYLHDFGAKELCIQRFRQYARNHPFGCVLEKMPGAAQ